MYERSAIVLERYIEKILMLDKIYNPKKNIENYNELINEIENYQEIITKETEMIQEFDNVAKKIHQIQQEQDKLYKVNQKLEEDRNKLFNDLGENSKTLETKLEKIEDSLDKNNMQFKKLRQEYILYLSDFSQKQKNRNKCEKERRVSEANYIEYIKKVKEEFREIEVTDIVNLKDFVISEKSQIKKEALEIMIKNGKNEKLAFNQDILKMAINIRINIAEKEAECYIILYEKMKKVLSEIDNDMIKLNKYKKALRDTSVKLAFLNAEKEYICGFLDYERMAIISGAKTHKKLMLEACNNFERDIIQIKNLYELIIKEVTNKATKKAYNELYNKTYLKNIEDKEKNFEEEVNNVNISMGTVINSNYWRIEGIKNIYNVFQEEISEKFEKDLSEYRIEEQQEDEDYNDDEYYEEDEDYYDEEEYEDYEEEDEDYNYDEDYEEEDEDYYDEEDDEDYEEYESEEDDYEYNENDEQKEIYGNEDNIEDIIEKSRKSIAKNNRGLFDKFFKK